MKKLSQMSGEWWIMNGSVAYADGDIGDINHEGMVLEYILNQHNLEDMDFFEVQQISDRKLASMGLNKQEIDAVKQRIDPRDYGMMYLGWKRVKGNNIQTYNLREEDLADILSGIDNILMNIGFEEDESELFLNIEVVSTGKFYPDIPLKVLETRNISSIQQYRSAKRLNWYRLSKIFK